MALDLRKVKRIHPRTLNRYLQELTLFHYLQITGGNNTAKAISTSSRTSVSSQKSKASIGKSLKKTLETIRKAYVNGQNEAFTPEKPVKPAKKSRSVGQNGVSTLQLLPRLQKR